MADTSKRRSTSRTKVIEVPQVDTFGHKQPQNLESEAAVLGALMVEQDAFSQISEILKPNSFYDHRHQLIYEAVQTLSIEQKPVDIITVDQNGRCPEQTVLTQVQEIVDAQRPVGADAQVFGAEEVPVNLSAGIVLTDEAQLEQVEETFRAALTEFCRDTALRTDVVSYAKLLRLLLDCDGVADVSAMTLCGAEDSLILSQRAIPVPGALQLREGT